jgi:hypothetical protein
MNVISEELSRMKCLFNYKPGSVISEQENVNPTNDDIVGKMYGNNKNNNKNNNKIYGKSYYIVGSNSYSLENSKSKVNAELKLFKNTKFVKNSDGNLIANTKYQFVSSIWGHVITDPIKNTESSNPSNDTYSGSITYSCKYKIFTPDKFKDMHYFDEEKTLQSQLDGVCKSKDVVKTDIKPGDSTDTTGKEATQPTQPTHTYPEDKNYKYAKDTAGNWWGLNIINNKWFNLIDYPESVEKLNTGAVKI